MAIAKAFAVAIHKVKEGQPAKAEALAFAEVAATAVAKAYAAAYVSIKSTSSGNKGCVFAQADAKAVGVAVAKAFAKAAALAVEDTGANKAVAEIDVTAISVATAEVKMTSVEYKEETILSNSCCRQSQKLKPRAVSLEKENSKPSRRLLLILLSPPTLKPLQEPLQRSVPVSASFFVSRRKNQRWSVSQVELRQPR